MPAQLSLPSHEDEQVADWNSQSVDDLATVAAVEAALDAASISATAVEAKLDRLLSHAASAAAARAATLASVAQSATVASDDAAELSSVLDSAARSAHALSTRIRFLDEALSAGTAALNRVDHVLTLRVCAEGAKTSLSAGDLPTAASHVQRYLALDPDVRDDPSSLAAVAQMTQSLAELSRKVRERADAAAVGDKDAQASVSIPALLAAVKLFVPIGLSEEGVTRFSSCIVSQIAREADADIRALLMDSPPPGGLSPEDQQQTHAVALARLFETLASCVHDSEIPVVEAFGPRALVSLVVSMQQQCDLQSNKILVRYVEARSLEQVARAVLSERASARDLDPLLNELSLISQRTAAYFDFLTSRCAGVANDPRDVDATLWPTPAAGETRAPLVILDECLRSSKLAEWTTDLAARYVSLEAYFMRENVRKAIRIDEHSGDAAVKTSTAVDDFFFVLQKVVNRSLTYGGSIEALLAMLQHMNSCMSGDLLAHVRRRLRETEEAMDQLLDLSATAPSLPSAALTVSYLTELAKANIPSSSSGGGAGRVADGDGEGGGGAKYDFFVALNNASVSAEYALRFQANVERLATEHYKASLLDDAARLGGPLGQIGETARSLAATSQQGVERMAAVLTSRIASVTEDILAHATYLVSDEAYNSGDSAQACFSQAFLDEVEAKVLHASVEERLTEPNWDALVRRVSEWAAATFESRVFLPGTGKGGSSSSAHSGKRFNALGGLRADRDVRSMSAYFAGKCRGSSVRDVFARLSQVAMLINMESPAEVYDIWGSNAGGMTWRLAPAEVRMALRLRVEWSAQSIDELRL
jgi:conserved oligomeric Golgi complex subunit 4